GVETGRCGLGRAPAARVRAGDLHMVRFRVRDAWSRDTRAMGRATPLRRELAISPRAESDVSRCRLGRTRRGDPFRLAVAPGLPCRPRGDLASLRDPVGRAVARADVR